MKKILTTLLLVLSLFFLPSPSLAQSPSPSPAPETVDVYALFWPVVPGKTVADPMFFLKQLKEGFDGMFKSGNVAQSEFQLNLSEKRLVEAAKLIENKDYSNALKSLNLNRDNRNEAVKLKKKAQEENQNANELTLKLVKSLENQQKALSYFQTQFPQDKQGEIGTLLNDLTLQISEAK